MTLISSVSRLLGACCIVLAYGAAVAAPAAPSPHVMSVAEWGGTPADPALARPHSITHITLHHQGESFPVGKDPVQYLRNLQTWSRTTKKWLDIPYHYVVDLDGRIYEGRSIDYAGDTNTAYDPKGHALIEVVGNFEEVKPNSKQIDAVVDLMTMLATKYKLPATSIHGHKDYAETACPGSNLYRFLENGYFRAMVSLRLNGVR